MRARYYDPASGRFTQMDPFPGLLSWPDTLNPYLYTLNNPVNWTDPSGKIIWIPFMIITGGFIAGIFNVYKYLTQINLDCFNLPEALRNFGDGFLIGAAGSLAFWLIVPLLPTLPAWISGAIGGWFAGAASTAIANILNGKDPWSNLLWGALFGAGMGALTGTILPNPGGRPAYAEWGRGWPLSGYPKTINSTYKVAGEVMQDFWNWFIAIHIAGFPK